MVGGTCGVRRVVVGVVFGLACRGAFRDKRFSHLDAVAVGITASDGIADFGGIWLLCDGRLPNRVAFNGGHPDGIPDALARKGQAEVEIGLCDFGRGTGCHFRLNCERTDGIDSVLHLGDERHFRQFEVVLVGQQLEVVHKPSGGGGGAAVAALAHDEAETHLGSACDVADVEALLFPPAVGRLGKSVVGSP